MGRLTFAAKNISMLYHMKNPLSNQQKRNFMKEMFPKYKNSIQADPNIRAAIDAAVKLNEGIEN